jgi:hypothetical protein
VLIYYLSQAARQVYHNIGGIVQKVIKVNFVLMVLDIRNGNFRNVSTPISPFPPAVDRSDMDQG